jgi:hypothetical protein
MEKQNYVTLSGVETSHRMQCAGFNFAHPDVVPCFLAFFSKPLLPRVRNRFSEGALQA